MAHKNRQERDREQALMWAQRMEVQSVQKKAVDNIKDMKDFDHVKRNNQTKLGNKQ